MAPVATSNGHVIPVSVPEVPQKVDFIKDRQVPAVADMDPSKLTITLTDSLKAIPEPSKLVFGQTMTDHMLIMNYDPELGWSAPLIQPYQPLQLDPASSCFQYCTNVFEGMKAYAGPDGKPRLFRPELNMARLQTSLGRVALPPINPEALLVLIRKLVMLEKRWIPNLPGYSLYIRPTVIGTRAALGVAASTHALLYVILCPAGLFFPNGVSDISLLAEHESVRSWPGGTGGYKLGLNYAPCFAPQRKAAQLGYMQILWLLGEDRRITEAGAMNFFVVVRRDGPRSEEEHGDLDVITPPLDGTILPGITRASVLALCASHSPETPLPGLPPRARLHTHERTVTMPEVVQLHRAGLLMEAFCVGTAVIVAPVSRIGFNGEDVVLSSEKRNGSKSVTEALAERLGAIQEGRFEWEGWSVPCDE